MFDPQVISVRSAAFCLIADRFVGARIKGSHPFDDSKADEATQKEEEEDHIKITPLKVERLILCHMREWIDCREKSVGS
jgi:hypothetical protein